MCDDCPPPTPPTPDPSKPVLSRRAFLAVAAVAGGAVAGFYTSCQPPKTPPLAPSPDPLSNAGTTSGPAATANATTTIASQPASASAPASGPAPDLGMELFPNAFGNPIAHAADAPVILIPRSQWTAAAPDRNHIVLMNGIDKITVHHTAGAMTTDAWNPTANTLEGIRGFHAGTSSSDRNWADIAYHFAVDRAGRVWQARPLVYQGAHVKGHNEHNLGIVLLGDFEAQKPTAAQLWSLAAFIGFLRPLYKIQLDNVFTHGELGQTSCPGKALQAFMTRTRKSWAAAEGIAWPPKLT